MGQSCSKPREAEPPLHDKEIGSVSSHAAQIHNPKFTVHKSKDQDGGCYKFYYRLPYIIILTRQLRETVSEYVALKCSKEDLRIIPFYS